MDQNETKNMYGILGALLRTKRNAAGITQDDLATDLDIDRRHIGRIESGQSKLSIVRLIDICKALNISAAEIIKQLEEKA